jgi:hypothetical protein
MRKLALILCLVGLAVAAATLAVPAIASAQSLQPPAKVTQFPTVVNIRGPSSNGWLTGAVTTQLGGSKGRAVEVFNRHGFFVGQATTGLTRGHSVGYYQVLVPLSQSPYSVYVFDRMNSAARTDEMSTFAVQKDATPPVMYETSGISILPQKGAGWFTGKVTTRLEAHAGQPRRTVLLYNSARFLGADVTGTTHGHGPGYWQIQVTGYAGISLTQVDAYAVDRFWPSPRLDSLPKMSVAIPYNAH